MNKKTTKQYDVFDLSKIILSLMIVAIHTSFLPNILYPWLRLAVPLFFLMSSFLLFSKINQEPNRRKEIVKKYVFRLCKYYLFWFIILLPITIYARKSWFNDGIILGIVRCILKPLLGSTFYASWYISASIIGVIVVDKLSSKINYKLLLPIFIVIYFVCCLTSSYKFIIGIDDTSKWIIEPHMSFMVSLLYILLGKIISEGKLKINKKLNVVLLLISSIVLYVEWLIIQKETGGINYDCYILIPAVSVLLFLLIINIKISLKKPKILRQLSSFIYPLHYSVSLPIITLLKHYFADGTILRIVLFFITIIVCLILFFLVKKLEKRFKILSNAY